MRGSQVTSAAALLVSRFVVGATFLAAGIDKVQAPGAFAEAVRGYHMLPPDLALPFAYILPWIEVLLGAYLIAGFISRMAASGTVALLGMFVVVLTAKLVSGDTAHACGCFGAGSQGNSLVAFLAGGDTITWWDVIRDVLLILLCLPVAWCGPGPCSIDEVLARRRIDSSP